MQITIIKTCYCDKERKENAYHCTSWHRCNNIACDYTFVPHTRTDIHHFHKHQDTFYIDRPLRQTDHQNTEFFHIETGANWWSLSCRIYLYCTTRGKQVIKSKREQNGDKKSNNAYSPRFGTNSLTVRPRIRVVATNPSLGISFGGRDNRDHNQSKHRGS